MAIKDLIPWTKTNQRDLAVRRDAGDPFELFRRDMDQLFNGFLSEWPGGRTSLMNRQFGSFVPEIDIKETDKEVRVTAELPGMEEKDIDVSLTEGVLTIKGEKREEHEEEKGDTFRSERRYGMFERSIALPNGIDANGAKASFKKGVLKITLPKTAEAQSNRRRIAIEG
jgi:HSP20 family protein